MEPIEMAVAILAAALVAFTLAWNFRKLKSKDKSCGCGGGCHGCRGCGGKH